jgi:outer membrane protein OmpA-like peptidoglycan-associated protein
MVKCMAFFFLLHFLLFIPGRAQRAYTLVTIHFDFNQSGLRPVDQTMIDSILTRTRSPFISLIKVSFSGHCDNIGGNRYNDSLSLARIAATRNYIVSKSLPHLVFGEEKGWGKRQPLNDNGDAKKRGLNRRVEIVVYTEGAGQPTPTGAIHTDTASNPAPMSATTDTASIAILPPAHGSGSPTEPPPPDSTTAPSLSEFFRDSALVGRSVVLRNLNFYPGRHIPITSSYVTLNELLKVMQDNPGLRIEIDGYVCCIRPDFDGLDFDTRTTDLSVQRARFVYKFLKGGGIKASRMKYLGFGASRKLFPEERNEEEEQANRRVEIKVTAKGK